MVHGLDVGTHSLNSNPFSRTGRRCTARSPVASLFSSTSLSVSVSRSVSRSRSLRFTHSLSLSRSHSLAISLSISLTRYLFLHLISFFISLTHWISLSLYLTHPLAISLFLPHSLTRHLSHKRQPDREATHCSIPGCDRAFSAVQRRHHCRQYPPSRQTVCLCERARVRERDGERR